MDTEEHRISKFYQDDYHLLFTQNRILKLFKAKTHLSLEKNLARNTYERVLEIGAGNGEHFAYVTHSFDTYTMLDLNENPFRHDFKDSRIRFVRGDIESINFHGATFDRIIMTCVLHHLSNPLKSLYNIRDLLSPGGVFSLFLPCDPGLVNRLNRFLVVNPIAKSLGIHSYTLVNAIEHRNHFLSLNHIVRYVFRNFDMQIRYFPTRLKIHDLNAFVVYQISRIA